MIKNKVLKFKIKITTKCRLKVSIEALVLYKTQKELVFIIRLYILMKPNRKNFKNEKVHSRIFTIFQLKNSRNQRALLRFCKNKKKGFFQKNKKEWAEWWNKINSQSLKRKNKKTILSIKAKKVCSHSLFHHLHHRKELIHPS